MTQFELKPPPAYDSAPSISVVEDEIVVVGPGAVAFSMTTTAAEEMHRRLGEALDGLRDAPTRGPGSAG
jgi:hypothetical protein